MSAPVLKVEGLVKRFGGLTATDHVDFDLADGEIHALIGPNGAGKSTLINQICGEMRQDEGRILLDGLDISGHSAPQRAKMGLARAFQVPSLLNDVTVLDNVTVAVQIRHHRTYRISDSPRGRRDLFAEAEGFLAGTGLAHRGDIVVSDLSHGERKQLELVVARATKPRLLLLDEPMAGLGASESQEMIETLSTLREAHGILLVEHDMDAVFNLADRISVLVYGRIIAHGTVDEIRADPEVQRAYLGEEDA
ncbi:ABC transporter ATP-binding protein [Acuticoccus sp. M5D2P5]|uniref:ABC transporter ATP-binding protein n=1 Tax=Acuticoccus kalidii TaxID=2910977 RepID=UPI001F30EDB8|nr:ABC transporter ATP-binding protein [Acuticoccus kalidii]MCF3936718.1 ABC transporter ATP-binding protein [Acuticoccus kalidii]